ncbi:MAG TPA: S8 family peptidase [Bacteriovoracaceae bacterium]|nr:S8 family peptidase [Bacteriovoracaceae bacterium]
MKHISCCFYTVLFSFFALSAQGADHDPHHLFIKMKLGHPLKASTHIINSQKIIPQLFLVTTNNLSELEAEVSQWEIEYTQRDNLHSVDSLPALSKSLTTNSFADEYIQRLWAFDEQWGMSVTKAYENLPPWMPEEVIVAVIDTGVDYRHEDLKNVMWTNPGEVPGDGIDNDGNGYIDDVFGINTVTRTRFRRKTTTDPMASHWHGTHVAGTIAAQINNGIGIAGVAHNVRIMSIRSVPDSGHESDSSIIESLLYAAKNGAKIINCSFGKPKTESFAVRDVINSIGVLVVAAAGNNSIGPIRWHDIDSKPQYPASFDSPNLLTVTSTTNKGELSSFSNIGKISVDIAAPGSNIFSTVNNNKYSSSSGTSMAAPNATGVAAMVLGYFPELSPQELKDVLMKSSKHSKSLEGKIRTPGIINLLEALNSASSLSLRESP